MNKKYLPIIIILAVALVAITALSIYQRLSIREVIEQMEFEKEQLEYEYEDLALQFDGYQELNIQNDSLQDLLGKEQQRVRDLLEELRITKVTNARRIAELKKELTTVRAVMVDYVHQIDSLYSTNERLTKENEQLTQNYYDVSIQAQQLQEEKSQLSAVVERASMLEVNQMAVTTLNKHDRKTRVVSQIEKFQIDFTLAKNITCAPGMKTVYLRLTDPSGEVMNEDSTRVFGYEDGQLTFTTFREIEYTGENQAGVFYVPLHQEAPQGVYNAHFFADSNLIGTYTFEIRK